MRKEDLVIGKWYTNPEWHYLSAVKLRDYSNEVFFHNEEISKPNGYKKIENHTTITDWSKLSEIPIENIQEDLPNGHPDLITGITEVKWVECIRSDTNDFTVGKFYNSPNPIDNKGHVRLHVPLVGAFWEFRAIIPRYFKWVDSIGANGFGRQTDSFVLNKVFDTTRERPISGHATSCWSKHLELYPKNYIAISKKEYDYNRVGGVLETMQSHKVECELLEFPTQGFCACPTREFYNFLKEKYTINIPSYPLKKIKGFAWGARGFWAIEKESQKKEYTIEQLNKFINNKKEEKDYGKNISNTEVRGFTSENTRPNITGTATIRCRGQQGAIGSRPNGNKACVDTRRANVIRVKRLERIGFRENS